MAATWPTALPLKIRYGSEFEFGGRSKAITEFENGPQVVRNRFPNIPFRTNLDLKFKDGEYITFLNFYTDTIKNGARKFYAPILVGLDIKVMLCQLISESIRPVAEDYNRWSVPVVLDVYGRYTIEEDLYYLLGLYGEDFVVYMTDQLQIVVNDTYPQAVEDYF